MDVIRERFEVEFEDRPAGHGCLRLGDCGWSWGWERPEFTLNDVLQDALKLDAGRMTRDVMTRVGMLLKKLGCTRLERRNGVSRFVYVLPAWSKYQQAQQFRDNQVGDRDGPLPL